jgi:hypothetical protein
MLLSNFAFDVKLRRYIAENALVAIQNCCEEPAAKKLVVAVMSERDQAFVFNPQVWTT